MRAAVASDHSHRRGSRCPCQAGDQDAEGQQGAQVAEDEGLVQLEEAQSRQATAADGITLAQEEQLRDLLDRVITRDPDADLLYRVIHAPLLARDGEDRDDGSDVAGDEGDDVQRG